MVGQEVGRNGGVRRHSPAAAAPVAPPAMRRPLALGLGKPQGRLTWMPGSMRATSCSDSMTPKILRSSWCFSASRVVASASLPSSWPGARARAWDEHGPDGRAQGICVAAHNLATVPAPVPRPLHSTGPAH